MKKLIEKLKIIFKCQPQLQKPVVSFCRVIIKQEGGIVLKTFEDASIVPRTNNFIYIDGKRHQVTSNVFNYDEKTIYVYVSFSF